MNKVYEFNKDRSYEDYDEKTGITRVIDVCEKSDGKITLRCYDKEMNSNGEFNAMAITLDEIWNIFFDIFLKG